MSIRHLPETLGLRERNKARLTHLPACIGKREQRSGDSTEFFSVGLFLCLISRELSLGAPGRQEKDSQNNKFTNKLFSLVLKAIHVNCTKSKNFPKFNKNNFKKLFVIPSSEDKQC